MKYIKDLSNNIIQHIKNTLYIASNNAVYGYDKLNEKTINVIKQLLLNNQNYINEKQIYKAIMHGYDLTKCKICGKQQTIKKRNRIYCSIQCKFKDNQYKQKVKNTLFKKYGVYHNLNIKEVKQKAIKNAASNTAKQKRRNTNFNKFGYQVCSKNEDVKQKMKQTNIEKYGNQFGVKNLNQVLKKSKLSMNRISWNNFKKFQNFIIPNFSFEQYDGIGKQYQWKCVLCGNIFKQKLKITKHISQFYSCPRCFKCFPKTNKFGGISVGQKQLLLFCKKYFLNIKENNRQFIKPYQVDILIPQIKLAIEFNGIYWHTINFNKINKHLLKTQMCQQKGYRLIHIWQDQWNNNKEQIKQKLIDIFTNNEKIDKSRLLDRCWYSTLQFQNYQILEPITIIKNKYKIENCGYLKI